MADERLRRPAPGRSAGGRGLAGWAQQRGVSLQAVAIQFGLRHPHVGCVLVGGKTAQEVQENVQAATAPLDAAIWDEVAERIRSGAGQAGPDPES